MYLRIINLEIYCLPQENVNQPVAQFVIRLIAHRQIHPGLLVHDTLIMREGIKTGFSVVSSHAAFTHTAEAHVGGSQMDDTVIDTWIDFFDTFCIYKLINNDAVVRSPGFLLLCMTRQIIPFYLYCFGTTRSSSAVQSIIACTSFCLMAFLARLITSSSSLRCSLERSFFLLSAR